MSQKNLLKMERLDKFLMRLFGRHDFARKHRHSATIAFASVKLQQAAAESVNTLSQGLDPAAALDHE